MLFKKTLKVASATALWMVALLGANSAMAQTLPTFSAETLTEAVAPFGIEIDHDGTAGDPGVFTTVMATVPVNERAAYYLEQAAAGDAGVHIRVVATGVLRFRAAPTVSIGSSATAADDATYTDGTITAPADARAVGGLAAGGTGYRYAVTGALTGRVVKSIRVAIVDDGAGDDANVLGMGKGGIMISVYDEQDDAHFGTGEPYDSKSRDVLTVASSVTAKAAPNNPVRNTASAVSRFTSISGQEAATRPYEISVGGFEVAVNGAHLDAADGESLTSNIPDPPTPAMSLYGQTGVNGSTRFHGDGGWAFASGFRFAAEPEAGAGQCSGAGPMGGAAGPQPADTPNGEGIAKSPLSEEDPTVDVIGGIAAAPWYLCVTISNENTDEIPAGSYMVDVNLTPARGDLRPFPPMGMAGILAGQILHDGTTVQIPYVTSYEGYTQRIVIVNRNKVDVGYAITFRAEGDGEIMGDNPHEGMLMAGQATVLKVDELVTLSNPTRAAATLTVAATSGTIDVATTMVNKMDQSTDTVVLH